ncbi:MAG: four helix bundle suffix domain-containing protein [Bacteroidales bacterium]|nr:four helix bundle suffix domain-containing protein [Bacteroidales bacterium]
MSVYIGFSYKYMTTDSWVMSKVLQLAVMDFCRRHLNRTNDPCGRQFDQTTQAARAVAANIAEGSARHDTSLETEMRLLDVARGSLSEVMDDFIFFVMDKRQTVWSNDNPEAYAVRGLRLETPCYGKDMMHDVAQHILRQRQRFATWLDHDDPQVVANAIIILCQRLIKMLRSQMEAILAQFELRGGFTENMTETRLKAKQEQNVSRGAPRCPRCGEVMMLRTIRKGERSGQQFRGCPNFYKTGCQGTLAVENK